MDLNSSGPEVITNAQRCKSAYIARLWLRALVMKTTLLDHLSLGPYKESVTSVQIQMPFHAVGRSFRPSGGSYAPDRSYPVFEDASTLLHISYVSTSEFAHLLVRATCYATFGTVT